MASRSSFGFTHRFNDDGTIDAICRQCFITVASVHKEGDLERSEHRHTCDPDLLEHYEAGLQTYNIIRP